HGLVPRHRYGCRRCGSCACGLFKRLCGGLVFLEARLTVRCRARRPLLAASRIGGGARPCRKGKPRPSASTGPDAEAMRVAKAPGTCEKGKPARRVPTSEPRVWLPMQHCKLP